MTFNPDTDMLAPERGRDAPSCPFVKITQLRGEVHCYLLEGHDGAHCSTEWWEWN